MRLKTDLGMFFDGSIVENQRFRSECARLGITFLAGAGLTLLGLALHDEHDDFTMRGSPLPFLMVSRLGEFSPQTNAHHILCWRMLLNLLFFSSLFRLSLAVLGMSMRTWLRRAIGSVSLGVILAIATLAYYQPVDPRTEQQAYEVRGAPFPFLAVGGEFSIAKERFVYRLSIRVVHLSWDVLLFSLAGYSSFAVRERLLKRFRSSSCHVSDVI